MKIEKILSQHRRDFSAIFKCDHCGFEKEGSGYDDRHFHEVIVPGLECPVCGKKAGYDYRPLATKYPDGVVV